MTIKIHKSNLIYFILLFLTFFSLFNPSIRNDYNIKFYITFLLITMFILSLKKINKNILLELYFILAYLAYAFIYLLSDNNINYMDFTIIFLSFFYMVVLSFFIGKSILSIKKYKKIFFFIVIAFLIRYSFFVFLNITNRPELFTENNFELMLLILMYIGYSHIENNIRLKNIILLIVSIIILESHSRSGIMSWLVVVFVLNIKLKLNKKNILLILILIFMFYLFIHFFLFRVTNNLESIDRVQFLIYFIQETHHWSLWEYLFGNPIITPLSDNTVSHFSYFKNLMSYKHDGTAYSIMFHAFILRILFDHGILGLIGIFYFINKILVISQYNLRERIAVLSLFFLNGLSVSSFGNIMGILGLFFLIIIKKESNEN